MNRSKLKIQVALSQLEYHEMYEKPFLIIQRELEIKKTYILTVKEYFSILIFKKK